MYCLVIITVVKQSQIKRPYPDFSKAKFY